MFKFMKSPPGELDLFKDANLYKTNENNNDNKTSYSSRIIFCALCTPSFHAYPSISVSHSQIVIAFKIKALGWPQAS